MFLLALVALGGQIEAATPSKASSLLGYEPRISPPLKDVKSDKKFFGPPFPADYPDDKRPVPDKKILDQVKKVGSAYPALQSKEDFDSDFVKDENSDKGAWQAQFEYDALRRKLAQEEADERRAEDRANREGRDADDAQNADDEAGRKVSDAQKDADAAGKGEDDVKRAEDFDGPPSDEKLKELKKAVEAAEERYEQQKKAFEECKKQLEDAKKELEDLKAQQKSMEEKLAADTKLWVEQKAVKLNMKKTKHDNFVKLQSEKVNAAQGKLDAAEKIKADMEKALAKEKAESAKAQDKLKKEKADMEKVQKQIDAAAKKLQDLHGYKPAQAAVTPTKVTWWQSLFR
jgi:DNA repair exonuclease SbcCD ATPase subunit